MPRSKRVNVKKKPPVSANTHYVGEDNRIYDPKQTTLEENSTKQRLYEHFTSISGPRDTRGVFS